MILAGFQVFSDNVLKVQNEIALIVQEIHFLSFILFVIRTQTLCYLNICHKYFYNRQMCHVTVKIKKFLLFKNPPQKNIICSTLNVWMLNCRVLWDVEAWNVFMMLFVQHCSKTSAAFIKQLHLYLKIHTD